MNLEYLKRGERITADHYHEVTRAARAQFMLGGSSDADGSISRPQKPPANYIQIQTSYEASVIPKNSVIELYGQNSGNFDILTYGFQKLDASGDTHVLVTNEFEAILPGNYALATVIGPDKPIKVRTGSANQPNLLDTCGPEDGGYKVSSLGEGLICIGQAQAIAGDPDGDSLITVVADGRGGASLRPYKITSQAYGGVADAFYQSSHPDGFTVKKVLRAGSNWSEEGDDITMFGSFMHGVAFTNAVIFGTKIKGRLEAVSGDCGHVFRDGIIVTADTATTGTVALQSSGAPVVPYTLPGWMAELFVVDDPVSVGFDQQSQMFWIIQRGCGTV